MKSLLKIIFTIAVISSLFGCKEKQTVEIRTPAEIKEEPQELPDIADVEFMDGLIGKVWHIYLEMRMALNDHDEDQVQQSARSMAESFSPDLMNLKSLSLKLSETEDIEAQRKIYAQLTQELGPLFEDALTAGSIYKMYCPLAFNNKGAYWYADVEETSNPYLDEDHPECRSLEKTITKKSN